MEIIYGKNPVLEFLKSGQAVNKIYLHDEKKKQYNEIFALAKAEKIPLKYVDKKTLDKLTDGERHQGVVLEKTAGEYTDLRELLERIAEKPDRLLLIPVGIQDPHNLGAILRTAEAAGVDGVIIPRQRAVQLTPAVYKASAGAAAHIPVARGGNIAQLLERLKELGYWVVVALPDGEPLYQSNPEGPLAVVVGGEERGPGKLIEKLGDYRISLPMQGKIESLNVSVATGVVLYELLRRRLFT